MLREAAAVIVDEDLVVHAGVAPAVPDSHRVEVGPPVRLRVGRRAIQFQRCGAISGRGCRQPIYATATSEQHCQKDGQEQEADTAHLRMPPGGVNTMKYTPGRHGVHRRACL